MSSRRQVLERLPQEVRLEGWVGPTMFTSEVRDGVVITLEELDRRFLGHEHARSLVIGTIRETEAAETDDGPSGGPYRGAVMSGANGWAYAAFCIDPRTENIVLIDFDDVRPTTRFVNSSLALFLASLNAFLEAWPRLAGSDDDAAVAWSAGVCRELEAIDPAAMSDGDDFWPVSLETYTF
ncbi:MAG TPA: SUKH-4 family immunity protein [Kofleriaceae bacterium]|nr:SUKH-4 family immunity protein [Kofleriaceae bacterium]